MSRQRPIRVVGRFVIFATVLVLFVGGAFSFSRLIRHAVNAGFNLDPESLPGAEVGGVVFEAVLIAPLVVWWILRYRRVVATKPHP